MSTNDFDPVIRDVHTHLEKVLIDQIPLRSSILKRTDSKLSLDNSILINDAEDIIIKSLLPLLVSVLKTPIDESNIINDDDDNDYGYDSVVSLLSTILCHKNYNDVLSFISQSDLIEGLRSGVSHLQVVCISQVIKASPPDILSNTPVVFELVELLATPRQQSSTEVIGATHRALCSLASHGDLVRRRLFSGDCLITLKQKLYHGDSILQGRLMSLITEILPFDRSSHQYIPGDIIAFPPDSINKDDDILLVLNKIQFYRDIISNPHPLTLINQISNQIERIAVLYTRLQEDPTMESFLANEIYTFFGALSSTHPAVFRELDVVYKITAVLEVPGVNFNREGTIMFLSLLSPAYLVEFLPSTIDSVPIMAHTVRILRNLIKYEPSYRRFTSTSNISFSEKLLDLPYLEFMVLLVGISAIPWGVNDLLSWTKVMDALLWKEDIQDPDTVSYRREVFENLIRNPSQVLSVWNDPIRAKYREFVHGIVENEPRAIVADESAD